MMRILIFIFLVLNAFFLKVNAQSPKQPESVNLKKLVVEGTVPGPDLWRVTDGNNELWLLGTLSPLPKKMKWNSKPIEAIIQSSQALMLPPSYFASLEGLGFLKKLSLVKSSIGIKKSPEKNKLIDIIPPDTYARWLNLKKKYIGNSRSIEKQRPIFASNKLFNKALSKTGLTKKTGITRKLTKIAKKNKLKIIRPNIKIKFDDPTSSIKKFKKSTLDDIACFSKTLERIETDLLTMSSRAKAWSYGDVKTIKSLPYIANNNTCQTALFESAIGEELGLKDSQIRLKEIWIEHAKSALKNNKTTFALIPISFLLEEKGVLFELEAAGFEIEIPSTLIDDTNFEAPVN